MTSEIASALRVLYGEDVFASSAHPKALHPERLKAAFRKRVLELHPDRSFILGKDPREMSEAFKDLKLAYDMLLDLPGFSQGRIVYRYRSASPEKGWSKPDGRIDRYWEDTIPEVNLLFGQYLYYAGLITHPCLQSAILWQRRQRPTFGRISRNWAYLSKEDVHAVISSSRNGERIGDAALRLGYLNRFQRNSVLGFQKYLQRPIGEFFREIGLLKEDEIDFLVRLHRKHNAGVPKRTGSRGFKT